MFDRPIAAAKLVLLWIGAIASLFSAAIVWAALRASIWLLCASVVSIIKLGSILHPRLPGRRTEAPSGL